VRPRRTRIIVALFAVLSAGLAANLLLFQSGKAGGAAQRADSERSRRLALVATGEARSGAGGESQPVIPAAAPQSAPAASPPARAPAKPAKAAEKPAESAPADPAGVIRAIQRELHNRGYEVGSQDGQPGLLTRAAVMAFEFDHGMGLTAEPSEAFLKGMIFGAAGRPGAGGPKPRTPQAEQIIRTVQQMLSAQHYNAGKADGTLGEETRRAIREFEADQKLPETGRVSGALLARLAQQAAGSVRAAQR
jgi:peptidoglycan hydrolase-like protein with peptidoglycan-binding domain